MTPQDVRRIALGLPESQESSHLGHPDYRSGGKVFAELQSDGLRVRLHHEQQTNLVREHPGCVAPVAGGWGLQGWTTVALTADEATLRSALTMAWQNVAPKGAIARMRLGAA